MEKMLMKTSKNEFINVYVVILSGQSLNIHKITLQPVKPTSSKKL